MNIDCKRVTELGIELRKLSITCKLKRDEIIKERHLVMQNSSMDEIAENLRKIENSLDEQARRFDCYSSALMRIAEVYSKNEQKIVDKSENCVKEGYKSIFQCVPFLLPSYLFTLLR